MQEWMAIHEENLQNLQEEQQEELTNVVDEEIVDVIELQATEAWVAKKDAKPVCTVADPKAKTNTQTEEGYWESDDKTPVFKVTDITVAEKDAKADCSAGVTVGSKVSYSSSADGQNAVTAPFKKAAPPKTWTAKDGAAKVCTID